MRELSVSVKQTLQIEKNYLMVSNSMVKTS